MAKLPPAKAAAATRGNLNCVKTMSENKGVFKLDIPQNKSTKMMTTVMIASRIWMCFAFI